MCSFLCVFIYLPFSIIIFRINSEWIDFNQAFVMWIFVSVGMIIIISSLYIKRGVINIGNKIKPVYLIYITAILSMYFISVTLSNFTLVGIEQLTELNDVRSNSKISGISAYVYLWLISVLLPYTIGILVHNKKSMYGILFSFIYVYFSFSMGAKILLVAPITFIAIYIWIYRYKMHTRYLFSGVILFIISLYFLGVFFPEQIYFAKALFLFRTISIPNLGFAIYFDYFNDNTFTYFTHIGVVADIFSIKNDIPLPVRLHLWYGLGNFNANFIVNDGYASLGFIGIIIISIIYSGIGYVLDVCSKGKSRIVVFFSLVYIIMFQANISLFTLLLSHGLVFLPLLYIFVSDDLNEKVL
jgi:hypothetical protein